MNDGAVLFRSERIYDFEAAGPWHDTFALIEILNINDRQFFLFELDFTILLQYAPRRITVGALPRFPAIERDVALVVGRDFASEQVIRWIKELGEPLIEYVKVFDQYVGAPIPDGKKSLAYKISYRASERTLTDAEVNNLHQSLVERLGNSFGAEQRS